MTQGCVKRILRAAPRALAIAVLAAGLAPWGCSGPASAGPGRETRPDSLVILHTNDVHSRLDPFEVNGGERVGGVAARSALIARERARGGRVILLDGGDLVQGTPYYNRFRGEPDHRLLDLLGYDAIALGNHDLDDGAAAWRRRAETTRTPILSANVFAAAESAWADRAAGPVPRAALRSVKWIGGGKTPAGTNLRYLATPYRIVERDGLRIAIFGLTTHSLDRIVAARKNAGVAVGSPIAAARELVPRLRDEADVVIALSHLGVDADRDLVDRVPGIDLVIGGHSHTPLFRPSLEGAAGGRATPIAQAGSWGRYLGRTSLRWSGDRARAAFGQLLTVRPEEGEDAAVEAVLASYRARLGADLDRIVCRVPRRVETKGLSTGDHPLGNFVADVIRDRTGAEIAIMNAGGIRSPLPAGEVRERDILSMLPFDNRLVVVRMTGAKVRSLLDGMARRYGKGGFGHASGVSYVARRDRAVEILVGTGPGGGDAARGEPLDGNRVYRVATIDFLADGGDYFDELRDAEPKERTEILLSTAAIEYLRAHPDHRFGKDGRVRWRGSTEALRDLGMR
jgi:2',3'-cyclic-nucleotide 2'-phosphodiesterase (5'-nucleotidase family)